MIQTNNIKIHINYLKIDQDFDIYKIGQECRGKSEVERKAILELVESIVDRISPALAVLYRYGGYLYAIFKKDTCKLEELQEYVQSILEGKPGNIFVTKISILERNSIYQNDLCQLFANMIPNMGTKDKFNNISGKLYYFNNKSFKKDDCVTAYKIAIESIENKRANYIVTIEAESYFKLAKVAMYHEKDIAKLESLPRYFIDEKDDLFKRVCGNVPKDQCFIKRNPGSKKNKNIAKDLDILDYEKFLNSKKGILYRFSQEFKEYFGDYIEIEWITLKKENVIKSYQYVEDKNIKMNRLNQLGIQLIDTIQDEQSDQFMQLLKNQILCNGIDNVCIGENNLNELKIRLIHDSDYYKSNELEDQHCSDLLTQHITYEALFEHGTNEINKNMVTKILQELMIKKDVYDRRISLFKWTCDDKVEYVNVESIYNKFTNKYEDLFTKAVVYPNGVLEFEHIKDSSTEEYKYYKKIFRDDFKKNYSYFVKPEMLITYKNTRILIDDTAIVVLPDLEELSFRLKNYHKDKVITASKLTEILNEFIQRFPEYKEDAESILFEMKQDPKTEYRYQQVVNNKNCSDANYVKPLFRLKNNKFVKTLMKFCRTEYRIVLNPCLKGDVVKLFQSVNILKDAYNEHVSYYYVGKKDVMKSDLKNSCHIRRVTVLEGEKDDWFINYIYDQLCVDFVRNGEYTVLPFINKYINEYKKT